MKYYFEDQDSAACYTIDYFREQMKEGGISEMQVYPAKIEYGTGYFYCQEYFEVGESGEGCGKFCEGYKPRNGKNGRCVHHSAPYGASGDPITIKLK